MPGDRALVPCQRCGDVCCLYLGLIAERSVGFGMPSRAVFGRPHLGVLPVIVGYLPRLHYCRAELDVRGLMNRRPSDDRPRCAAHAVRSSHVAFAGDGFCKLSQTNRAVLRETTLSGGSLGSCVDEERSQLRELM